MNQKEDPDTSYVKQQNEMTESISQHRKNRHDENVLKEFNSALADLEKKYVTNQSKSSLPIVFICGAPRSGTTLLSQVLASTGMFNYIDNFIARFWQSPYIGFYLEKILGLRNKWNEKGRTFESEFGKTVGLLDPHEFTYFWEHWLKPSTPHHIISTDHIDMIDIGGLNNEINAMLNSYNNPIFFKNIWFLSNPKLAYALFDNVYFIFIKRDIIENALSIYNARIIYNGNENAWFSVKPSNYSDLDNLPPEHQIIGQIKSINRELMTQKNDFPGRVLDVQYEELCSNPFDIVKSVAKHIGIERHIIHSLSNPLPHAFPRRKRSVPSDLINKFKSATESVII